MDQFSVDENETLSPELLLHGLQMLRQIQLENHQAQFIDSPGTLSSITEIISHFSSSTSYNTFRTLLQSTDNENEFSRPNDISHHNHLKLSDKINSIDLMDGISLLNSPDIEHSSIPPLNQDIETENVAQNISYQHQNEIESHLTDKSPKGVGCKLNNIDDIPVFPKKVNFEMLVKENLEKAPKQYPVNNESKPKKPFLKRGTGMARFGLNKQDLQIQTTNSLPWRKQIDVSQSNKPVTKSDEQNDIKKPKSLLKKNSFNNLPNETEFGSGKHKDHNNECNKASNNIQCLPKEYNDQKSPIHSKLKTNSMKNYTCTPLSKAQDDLLRQLKQSNYYQQFVSPAKSIISDISLDEHLTQVQKEKENVEQKMFELLERKASHESFSIENSFLQRFLRNRNLECSGESTPLVLQKCLANKPELFQLYPEPKETSDQSCTETSECTECDHDACSTSSSSCSCQTVENLNERKQQNIKKDVNQNDTLKTNMADMNAKLTATSELLKDRLKELEDEIETFRKENNCLTKMREELDAERQKFYAEKSTFEQKFNEEKILSEYHLTEEKEKLEKQKQVYERYVREIRGRVNKKEKDEVINLKNEVAKLKEEIRIKDAKSTSSIARLRNQLKINEKEKKQMQEEIEKLRKENKRLQHSSEVTRRLTNIKYLEDINKKLSDMSARESRISIDPNVKYKAYEIEKQCRKPQTTMNKLRSRAKSVPNLNVTSRYAKYFSQKDSLEANNSLEKFENRMYEHDDVLSDTCSENHDGEIIKSDSEEENEDKLEKLYMETFHNSTKSSKSSLSHSDGLDNSDDFFLKSRNSRTGHSTSRHSNTSQKSSPQSNTSKNALSKSPVSILSYKSQSADRPNIEKNENSTSNKMLCPKEIIREDGSKELHFPNGNVKIISCDGKYSKFMYYNGDVKENFYDDGRIKYYYAETKTYHTTYVDGLEVLEFPDGQIEKRYRDGSSEIRLPNGTVRYNDPKNIHVREEWRFPDGTRLTISANGEKRVFFTNGQVEVHCKDHTRREFPDGTVKLVYSDGTLETRYSSGRIRIKDKHGNLLMDSAR